VKVLLDENFPLALYYRLKDAGRDVEHIIVLGLRGLPDDAIRRRVIEEDLVLLTQDTEFLPLPIQRRGAVIVSRVPQNLPIAARVEVWGQALDRFERERPRGNTFELRETGELVPWNAPHVS